MQHDGNYRAACGGLVVEGLVEGIVDFLQGHLEHNIETRYVISPCGACCNVL